MSCKDEEKTKPVFVADYPELAKVDGKITIFAKFEGTLCDDVTLAGSHYLKVDSINADWATDSIEAMGLFIPARVIDGKDWGAEGWWEITVDLTPTSEVLYGDNKEFTCVIAAKPVQLKDGEFPSDWSSQVGYHSESDVVVKDGSVDVRPGYANECNIYFTTNATAAIIFKTWKKDPCVPTPKHDYTFHVTVPAATGDAEVRIVGGMNGWNIGDANSVLVKGGDGKYSITFAQLEEGTEYKYVVNGSWDNEELAAEEEGAGCAEAISNRVTGAEATINDVVENWRGVTATRCP